MVTARNPGPKELAEDTQLPPRLDMLLDMPPASKDLQLKYAWNSEDRSLNIFVKVGTMRSIADISVGES